jgi:glycogen operon protein
VTGPEVQALVLSALRHFVTQAGIDGFRFDLAPVHGPVERRLLADARLLQPSPMIRSCMTG